MRGLSLPWQKRRKRRFSRGLQADVAWGAAMLRANFLRWGAVFSLMMSFAGYRLRGPMRQIAGGMWAPAMFRVCGAGYVSSTGAYCYWKYGSSASRKPIDELEGDDVRVYVENEQRATWRGCIFPIYIEKKAFFRRRAPRVGARRIASMIC
jgi:hypothetical protein